MTAPNAEKASHPISGMTFDVTVEIPKGGKNKYEVDHETGRIRLDRTLFTATQYPADYGFVPHTLAEDGDPLDVLVLLDEPTFPGCHILARPVAVFWMRDEKGPDAKVLCVPATDPRADRFLELADLPGHLLEEISHFFEVYKALEPGKLTSTQGWHSAAIAEAVVTEARQRAAKEH